MRRWKISTTMMIGMVTSTAAAATLAIGCWNWDSPVKKASDAGTVRAAVVDVSVFANRKSFHAKMKTRDPGRERARRGERQDDAAERLPRRRAVHLRRLLELPRDLAVRTPTACRSRAAG